MAGIRLSSLPVASTLGDTDLMYVASSGTTSSSVTWAVVKSYMASATVSDTAYDATSWNGVTTIAPSKNAIRDLAVTLVTLTGSETLTNKTLTSPTLTTPALGTPSSGVLSGCTGYPLAQLTGAGTGVLTALAVNTGSAGAFVLFNGDAGTPSALVGTNITGTAAGLTAGVASAVAASGITGTTLAANVVTSSITTVGALNSGSITSGFGSIDVGADAISGGAITSTIAAATSPVVISNLSTATTLGLLTFNNTFTGAGAIGLAGGGGGSILYYLVPTGGTHNFLVNNSSIGTFTSTGLNNTVIGATTPAAGSFNQVSLKAGNALALYDSANADYAYIKNNGSSAATQEIVYVANGSGTSAHTFKTYSGGVVDALKLAPNGAATLANGLDVTGTLSATGTIYGYTGIFDPSASSTTGFYISNSASDYQLVISRANNDGILLKRTGSDGAVQTYYRDTTLVGSISVTTTATAYNTSSDARLKTNVRDFTADDSGRIIDGLRPRWFDWKASDENGKGIIGFIAQEEHAVSPALARMGAVTVGDDDPDTVTKQWAVDSGKLVPILVAEIKSLRARLAAAGIA